ncbi:hypothetical protein ACTFIW_002076 [Dictyostelium discoideum]|uniref:Seven transmembrane domain-containing tyrosine-protein kinase 1 n=1 Tax=Dictyostelium discoideum TaxID=44689 RepID=7TMK1_DICDI|nr:hypothetical protein DDB_G0285463 [Dictyostelium discoideum AX4]Q54N73.1 RecName: Full=Seven transmembrane domain-containing tyrosine-protein kinase 1 [Dictyostelium discoideum]EAL64569.1 hypothetical protein DDB_G0285463 [Dictyostelium discoideum AX4]|eukprot:XP_638070.1 hypothetical protein DDB_G0285463 [Dictyostelium discoideum AX4]
MDTSCVSINQCGFCTYLFNRSIPLAGEGDGAIMFNTMVDSMALGYIFSALYLLFRLQRSYTYLQKSSNNNNGNGNGNGSSNNDIISINSSNGLNRSGVKISQDTLWDKNFGISIDHPRIINSTYFKYTLFVSLWLAFEGLLLLFLPPNSLAYPAFVIIVGTGHIVTDNWVLVFLYGKEDDRFSARRSFYSCTLLYLIICCTTLASFFDDQTMCKKNDCQTFMFQDEYTSLAITVASLVVYTIVLGMTIKRSFLRPTGRIWLLFLMGYNCISSVGALLNILDVDAGYCFLGIAAIIYSFSYGPLLFRTCGNDTNLLRARGEFLPLLTNFQEYTSLFGRESISTSGEGATTALQLSAFYIRFNEFKFGQVIGEGYFGEVRKAVWKGAVVAVKILHRNSFRNTDGNKEENVFLKEVAILSILRHPNVLQFLGVCSETNLNGIVTEYMGGGSLDRLLTDRYFLIKQNPILAWNMAISIARGMFYLHDWKPNPILHRDLSTKNILLDESLTIAKVADFGLSKEQGFEMTSTVGHLCYQAPEVFIGELYTPKADVYSFGLLVWCIITGEQPNQNLQPLKMAHLAAYENYRPPMPQPMDPMWENLGKLIEMCWKKSPEERPSFSFILDFLEANVPISNTYVPPLKCISDNSVSNNFNNNNNTLNNGSTNNLGLLTLSFSTLNLQKQGGGAEEFHYIDG